MELLVIIVILALAVGAVFYFRNYSKNPFDVNQDGKVNMDDAKVATEKVAESVVQAADLNKDGKVDVADAKVVATKTKETAKKVATKAATTAKSTVDKVKTAAKKPAAKKPTKTA